MGQRKNNHMQKLTIEAIQEKKKRGEKITMLTAYDYPMAAIVDQCGVDIILVGDSLANVVLGLPSTRDVNMDMMLYHTHAVRRAVNWALLVGDMPFSSYQVDMRQAVGNARRFMDEGGVEAVKIEWFDQCLRVVGDLIKEKIPVMGHVGLTPQTAEELGGFKVQGTSASAAKKILDQAKSLEDAGCFSVVLECVPSRVSEMITGQLRIPTIGIGAGNCCDGQVLVIHDLIGLYHGQSPKFVKRFADTGGIIKKGVEQFCEEVKNQKYPDPAHSFKIAEEEFQKLMGMISA